MSTVIRHRSPWRCIEEVEFATLEWVDWFNNRRLVKNIRLVDADHDIDCKIDGIGSMKLKIELVKKV